MRKNFKSYISFLLVAFLSLSSFGNEQSKIYTIVIDPGHGGKDVGAVDNGQKEKDINFGVATKLSRLIKKNLRNVKVIQTRNDDSFITLQQRADIANKNKGDLFISIHTNSVDKSNPNRKSIEGASVYALGLHKDQNNLQVARRENSVIELENNYEQKYSGFDPNKDESYIIFEMAQKSNLSHSLKFANLAQKNLVSKAGRKDKGVKQAGFWVLWATSMPAVLVELDFICNPASANFLGSEKGQEKMAQALYDAVEKYIISITSNTPQRSVGKVSHTNIADNDQPQENINKGAEEQIMPTLMEVEPEVKIVNLSNRKSSSASVAFSRKRRSANSRRNSELQDYEAEVLDIHSEKDRFLSVSKVEKPVVEEVITQRYQPVTKKKSKVSASSEKNSAKKVVSQKKENNASSVRIVNNKIVTVNKQNSEKTGVDVAKHEVIKTLSGRNNVIAVQRSGVNERISDSSNKFVSLKSEKTKLRTIYKIQLLESEELLKQNDKRFCGLKPIKSFRENNKYKYTYGESENKEEMESMLGEVKLLVPTAHIISNHR